MARIRTRAASAIAAASAAAMLALSAAGCAADCQDACDNYAKVCASVFGPENLQFDRGACTDSCESNLERCTNQNSRVACVAAAESCDAARGCGCEH